VVSGGFGSVAVRGGRRQLTGVVSLLDRVGLESGVCTFSFDCWNKFRGARRGCHLSIDPRLRLAAEI
jgi:hypothetical protein